MKNLLFSNKKTVKHLVSNISAKLLPPYSRLLLLGDSANWVLSWEMRELARISMHLGIKVISETWYPVITNQSAFFSNHFSFFNSEPWRHTHNRLAVAYLHGLPDRGEPEFDRAYEKLCKIHDSIYRIQVTHREMEVLVLNSGINPEKVYRIPIGINLNYFPFRNATLKHTARKRLGIPQSAVVVGSFQKDGIGWGEGLQPKLIKGPDILLQVIARLSEQIQELYILLSGPARGYIIQGLERLGVPYQHMYAKHYPDISMLFQALDLYLITSRQEGGPKAVLESMASGVPLVTTHVGQAMDLVKHGANAWMVDIEDVDGLVFWANFVLNNPGNISEILFSARRTAELNSYDSLIPLWKQFMNGFVKWEN